MLELEKEGGEKKIVRNLLEIKSFQQYERSSLLEYYRDSLKYQTNSASNSLYLL